MRPHSNRDRPFHLGPWPLERLPRADTVALDAVPALYEASAGGPDSIAACLPDYLELFRTALDGSIAPAVAPVPADPPIRAYNLKAHAYFLDADLVGACALDAGDWTGSALPGHTHALVFLVEYGREPRDSDPGHVWIAGTNTARTDVRATEVAAVLSGYVRWMGYAARGHAAGATLLDLDRLAVKAGLVRVANGRLVAPFLSRGFRIAAVSTAYALAPDRPLAPDGPLVPDDPELRDGVGGSRPLWWYDALERRPVHMGRYAMESIPHADEPSTLLIREELKRVPKRGDFFKRAESGDLGQRAQRERMRFPMKHPYALGMSPLIRGMVPLQGVRHTLTSTGIGGDLSDPQRNADAMKALAHYLGADFVGICRAEPWMYYSHDDETGAPIEPYHAYAVVMLIDQGFETMDGASGDDWISASQSMRAYLRGAEIAGIMAAHCRRMGYSARTHSNAHSEVIHNPAILMAGLGEVSRIGDTLLNPFIGPRSKSVVFTTELPMVVDRPIDFGLQRFCAGCYKCARECPCNAIPFGGKVIFNGYETWKADVDKCTKYRVTNMKGSACGRCMKTCPWNREDLVESERLMWKSIRHPEQAPEIAALDDRIGAGARNPAKKWWFDLEVIDGVAVMPPAGTNARNLDLDRMRLARGQRLAMFPVELMPPPGSTKREVYPVDRAAGIQRYEEAETPEAARLRLARDA